VSHQVWEWEQQLTMLRSGTTVSAVEAAGRLHEFGAPSLQPLCDALAHPVPRVRFAAASALVKLDDRAAIGPLRDALMRCFYGRSARKQLVVGYLGTGLAVLGCAVMTVAFPFVALETLFRGGLTAVFNRLMRPGDSSPQPPSRRDAVEYLSAIVQLAERHPDRSLRTLLPELRAAAADHLSHDGDLREASRVAADRLSELSARLEALPLPASGAAGAVEALLLPSADRSIHMGS
jgi:hypothetical protein